VPREPHQDARNLTPHRVAKRMFRPAMARQLQLRGSAVAPLVDAGCEQRASLGARARGCFSLQARRSLRTPSDVSDGGVLRAPLSTEQLPPNPDALVSMALKKRFSATSAADPGVAASRLPAGYSNS